MPSDLHRLSIWLREQGVDEAVIAYASHCTSLGRCETFSNRSRLVQHRGPEVRQDLVILRARNTLVAVRTELINTTRGLVKSAGARLPKCASLSFSKKVEESIPVEIREALLR